MLSGKLWLRFNSEGLCSALAKCPKEMELLVGSGWVFCVYILILLIVMYFYGQKELEHDFRQKSLFIFIVTFIYLFVAIIRD